MDLLSFGALRASSARRSTGSIDALGGDSSGLGVPSGSVGTVAAAILAVDGERAWARRPYGDWYGRFPPAGSRAHSGVTGTLLSVLPLASHSVPGSARACAPGSVPVVLAPACEPAPGRPYGFPGTRGPRPGDGEGHADPARPELSLASFVLLFPRESLQKGRICGRLLH